MSNTNEEEVSMATEVCPKVDFLSNYLNLNLNLGIDD